MEQNTTHEDPGDPTPTTAGSGRSWRRPRQNRLIAGVAAVIAERAGLPLWLVRTAFVLATLAGGLGLVAYLGAWALIPDETAERSLTDEWRTRFAASERAGEKTGLVLIAVAAVLAVGALGSLAAPLTIATLLVVLGIALIRPIEH